MAPSNRMCSVYGCSNSYKNTSKLKGQRQPVRFYSFPSLSKPWLNERRLTWIKFVNRKTKEGKAWEPTNCSTICSEHFVGGSKCEDPRETNYNPTIYTTPQRSKKQAFRYKVPNEIPDSTKTGQRKVTDATVTAQQTVELSKDSFYSESDEEEFQNLSDNSSESGNCSVEIDFEPSLDDSGVLQKPSFIRVIKRFVKTYRNVGVQTDSNSIPKTKTGPLLEFSGRHDGGHVATMPYLKERRLCWIQFCNRETSDGKPWEPSKNGHICSEHFVGGSKSEDPRKINYLPTIPPPLPPQKLGVLGRQGKLRKYAKICRGRKLLAVSSSSPPSSPSPLPVPPSRLLKEEEDNSLEELEVQVFTSKVGECSKEAEEQEGEGFIEEIENNFEEMDHDTSSEISYLEEEEVEGSLEDEESVSENPSTLKNRYLIRVVKRFVRKNTEASTQTDKSVETGTLLEFSARFDGPHVATVVAHGDS
ncbi:unnamed protein product [Orchesella dallaii]|uniref:THAP-type domain-containing protein n=1 Tax=Orchesella dallaii TaxID=48710 RepID=A0ABP1QYI5_9HEXA